jgi:hypothetical protein
MVSFELFGDYCSSLQDLTAAKDRTVFEILRRCMRQHRSAGIEMMSSFT